MSWFARGEVEQLRRDLDHERVARGAIEAEIERLHAGFDAVPVGIVLADERGKQLVRNRAAALGGHVELLVEEAVERLLASAVGGTAAEQRLTLFGPPQRVLLIRGIPLAKGGGLAVIDDLSDRARVDAVRTDFVSNISHELKTPVGALAILAEALADSDDIEVNRHLALKMVEEAHRASGTIDDLLELSRIELGGPGDREDVSLSAVVGEAAARHRLIADTVGVELQVKCISPESVQGDRLQLVSAVSNLIDNAVKYSNKGGIVTVSAHEVNGCVEIEVADTGIGIPARDLDRVFERFYRVDRARSRTTGGTGLGLAIVRHVATNHGGDVTVRSREGEGSTFTLRIPMGEGS
ncbi:MAG: ATP-binding protein [Ilumatobacteraceae bacterium]|nr:ATP-binding protein [Acidimicrobiaceae bacterium]MBP6488076.1 ATP-binding protein [Ilumatobacteraceae bacterium]MBK9969847.1 ATP-binding protein [Acidimicrobiaceae bacterium]MBP7889450.1 ATP-binding protein [Ilumatobacteraceae bacterium]MBP8208877.1 ATP-binding protein [Ilumatobacteraceae bacterium]